MKKQVDQWRRWRWSGGGGWRVPGIKWFLLFLETHVSFFTRLMLFEVFFGFVVEKWEGSIGLKESCFSCQSKSTGKLSKYFVFIKHVFIISIYQSSQTIVVLEMFVISIYLKIKAYWYVCPCVAIWLSTENLLQQWLNWNIFSKFLIEITSQ